MTLEDTIQAVESLIEQYSLDINEPVARAVESRLTTQKFGYFNGKKVSRRDLKITVCQVQKTDDYTKAIVKTTDTKTFIIKKDPQRFIEELTDIQDVAYL